MLISHSLSLPAVLPCLLYLMMSEIDPFSICVQYKCLHFLLPAVKELNQ